MFMNIQRSAIFFLVVVIAVTTMVVVALAEEPGIDDHDTVPGDVLPVIQAERNLPPCGAFDEMRQLQPPAPVTPTPTNTPDPNAPAPTPTNTPRPAPSEDRVG